MRDEPDISGLASREDRTVSIMVWNYHDDDVPAPPAGVDLSVEARGE